MIRTHINVCIYTTKLNSKKKTSTIVVGGTFFCVSLLLASKCFFNLNVSLRLSIRPLFITLILFEFILYYLI